MRGISEAPFGEHCECNFTISRMHARVTAAFELHHFFLLPLHSLSTFTALSVSLRYYQLAKLARQLLLVGSRQRKGQEGNQAAVRF